DAPDPEPVAELRRRLEEAEETLRAIRDGEIDALVMRGARQDEVFTLEGGTESYRAFMEAMDLGAAALDGGGRLSRAHAAPGDLTGVASQVLQQEGLDAALGLETAALVRSVVAAASGGAKQTAEIAHRVGGRPRHLLVSASAFAMGPTSGIAVTFA